MMKKHSFLCEILIFCVILLLLVLPSVVSTFFQRSDYSISFSVFPYLPFTFCVCSIALYCFFYQKSEVPFTGKSFFYKILFPMTFTFCLLFCFGLIITFISKIIPPKILPVFAKNVDIKSPEGIKEIVFCLLNFLFAATYEEIVYRFFITDLLHQMIQRKSNKKFWLYFSEVFALVLFSIGHLYMGLLAILNAVIAHIILRKCYKKCGLIYTGILAHFFYNLLVFILL